MISAFGVDHGVISKAEWTPRQKKVVRNNRRRTNAVNAAAIAAGAGASGTALHYETSMRRHATKATHAWNNGDLNGFVIHDGKRMAALKNGSRAGLTALGVTAAGGAAVLANNAYSQHKRKKAFGG